MIYQFAHKRPEILPLLNFHIAHLCNQFNLVFALLILMPPFISINFCQNKPILFAKKKKYIIFLALEAHPVVSHIANF